jgi:hypothetical protein
MYRAIFLISTEKYYPHKLSLRSAPTEIKSWENGFKFFYLMSVIFFVLRLGLINFPVETKLYIGVAFSSPGNSEMWLSIACFGL